MARRYLSADDLGAFFEARVDDPAPHVAGNETHRSHY